jgi:uncharacterized delta-60 repeat protein
MRKNRFALVSIGAWIVASTAWAKSGDPDTHFGAAGISSLHFSSPILSVAEPIDIDRHNRIVFGVSTADGDLIAALNADGSIDTSFGSAGYVWLDQYVADVKVDSHNRIVVAETDDSASSLGIRVTRYLDSGLIDPTFGTGGAALLTYAYEDIVPNAITLSADDEVFLVGTEPSEPTTGDSRILVIHVDNTGKLDPAFGVGGVRSLSLLLPGTEQSYGKSIALGAHGEIVVTGYTTLSSHIVVDDIVKLTPAGNSDVTFGDGTGVVQTDAVPMLPSPRYSFSESVAIDASGNIITAGFAGTTADFRSTFYVKRHQPNGKPDLTFNGGAPKLFNAAGFTTGRAATVIVDGRDRIVVTGTTAKDIRSPAQSLVFRLNDNGSFDPTFGDHAGYQLLSEHVENGRSAFAHSGDIVVIGHSDDASSLLIQERIGYDLPPIMPPDHF